MANESLKIGIILGSTREGRVSPQVGQWVLDQAKDRGASYELIDIKDYELPLLGEAEAEDNLPKYNAKLNELDGFIFIVSEYNHAMSGALKNALDSARDAWFHKAAGIVSYGSAGGVRAAEQVRLVLAELNVADVRTHVFFSLFDDFNKNGFNPRDVHLENLTTLFDQVETWATALKTVR